MVQQVDKESNVSSHSRNMNTDGISEQLQGNS